ncbi:RagB/SusD family nutrient uptake outer membrane protein [Sphingobacterium hungaricum]|uniref:RagB/SusD family nutrient uptake outer membrane protein n=1 Tax=Sphingobacterium hungaricum TaxID=2082723 RepID=A0A928UW68_9SPHI|nr:RagB/SusD family nutrient uptake outer membrane protein [Sphingobacterium hungaricum]MBE8714436.1 RagB/SusD family nutrient uptake outer membrane protein [Sphingobacterium hungaricum]
MKKIVKQVYIGAFALLTLTTFSGCEKFLDLKPTNALLADNAVYDAKTSRALVNAGYSNLKSYSIGSALTLAVLPGDNVFFAGSQSQNIELDNHAFTVTNSAIVGAYASSYALINVVNWAISEIPKVEDATFAEGEQNKLIGEAYFIRAFAYFNLVRSWGGVQLQLNPTTDLTSLGAISRSTEEQTYAQILSDLKSSEDLLPADDGQTRNKLQKAIVRAFRAKVLLYAKRFEEAETEATAVIQNPKYALLKPYNKFFVAPFLTSESVFELSATATNAGTSGSAWFPASGTPRGSYEFRPSNEIINLLNDPAKGGNRKSLIATRGTDVFVNLYHTVSPNINPAYVIRIADLHLIRAEARARKANPDYAGAIADLNLIKDRAEATLYPVGNTDKDAIVQSIWDERRLEFAFEADRWYDLVRTEQAEEVLGVSKNFWIFPIPQSDVLSDPDLNGTNNPGY